MTAAHVGEVGLHIFPDFSGAESALNSQLGRMGSSIGGSFGSDFSKGFEKHTRNLGGAVSKGLDKGAGLVKGGLSLGGKIVGGIGSAVGTGIKTVGKVAATGLGVGMAGVGIVAGTAISKGLSRTLDIEDAKKKLEGIGYGQGSISRIMDDALGSVKGTAYGLEEAATASASAVAAGIKPGKELLGYLTSIGDAATQGGTDFNSMAQIFNKVTASGKAQGEVFQQLNSVGIPIVQMIAEEMGVTADEVYKLGAEGKVSADIFMGAMSQIEGAALKSGETTRGAFANLGAAMGRLGEQAVAGVFPFARVFAVEMTEAADSLTESLSPVFDKMASKYAPALNSFLEGSGKRIASFVEGSVPAFERLADAVAGAFGYIKQGWQGIQNTLADNGLNAKSIFTGFIDGIGQAIILTGKFIGSLSPLGQSISRLFADSVNSGVGNKIFSFLDGAISNFGIFMGHVGDFLEGAIPSLINFGREFFGVMGEAVKSILPSFEGLSGKGLAQGLTDALPGIMDFASQLKDIVVAGAPFIKMFAGEAIKGIGTAFKIVSDAVSAALPYIEKFAGWLSENKDSLQKWVGPLVGVAAGLGALGIAAKLSFGNVGNSAQQAVGGVSGFDKALQNMFYASSIITNRKEVFGFLTGWARPSKTATTALQGVTTATVSTRRSLLQVAGSGISGFFVKLGGAIKTAAIGMGSFARAAILASGSALKGLALGLRTAAAATWRFTVALLANPITWIVIAVGALIAGIVLLALNWDKVTAAVGGAWDALTNFFSAGFEKVGEWGTNVGTAVNDWFSGAKGTVATVYSEITSSFMSSLSTLGGFFSSVGEGIVSAFGFAKEGVREVFGQIGNLAQQGMSGLQGAFSFLTDGVSDAFRGVGNFIIGVVNLAINGINRLFSAMNSLRINIPNWVPGIGGNSWGFNLPQFANIPVLDTGGDTVRPTIAMLSANGVPETVTNRGKTNEMIERTNRLLRKDDAQNSGRSISIHGGIRIDATEAVSAEEIFSMFSNRLEYVS